MLVVLALALACTRGGPVAVVHRADATTVSVDLEVASTPAAMERGLMYRTSLPEGSGMLFVFPEDADHSFWMKNTLIPLDMVFIAPDGTVHRIESDTEPFSTALISSEGAVLGVVELNAGAAARIGLKRGDRVVYPGLGTSGQ
jgi:uncharacterized protein